MRLTPYHIEDLQAVRDEKVWLSSAGFESAGQRLDDEADARFNDLWMGDLIDADIHGAHEPAQVVLTSWGEQALARAEQESSR